MRTGFGVAPKTSLTLNSTTRETGKLKTFAIAGTLLASTREACAAQNSPHRVSHAQVHNSGSSSAFARVANRLGYPLSRITAKTVDPEPDISAAPTSGCLSNHIFSCARKTNFSKTGRSRSFTNVWPSNSRDVYETPGISRESRHREYAQCVGTPNSGFSNKSGNGAPNLVEFTSSPRPLHTAAD